MAVAKEQIRQIISENNINSVADIYTLLKDSFKDILQELMEAELDATLGYEKNHKGDLQTDNKRNGHSTKVSAKYCYVTHELRLHQNDRCKRFTLF